MLQNNSKLEAIFKLYLKALIKEIIYHINQGVVEKFNQLQENQTDSKTLLDAMEVCKKYKVSKSSLERYIREGLKFSSKSKGYKRLFTQKDLDNWFDNRKSNKKNRSNG